jgi:hypothetical protein
VSAQHTPVERRRSERQINNARRIRAREQAQSPIVVVACCATKLDHAAEARDLYVSDLFKKARAYAELLGGRWLILSAKHGILNPGRVIEPYDEFLCDKSPREHAAWIKLVRKQWWNGERRPVVLLAGAAYRTAFEGIEHTAPMARMGIGQQKQWLKQQVAAIGGDAGSHLAALRALHDVCTSMELEHEAKRPTEAEYQAAMTVAGALIAKATGSAS